MEFFQVPSSLADGLGCPLSLGVGMEGSVAAEGGGVADHIYVSGIFDSKGVKRIGVKRVVRGCVLVFAASTAVWRWQWEPSNKPSGLFGRRES